MSWLREHALYLAWIISLAGFALSLFFGEVLHLEPCRLCWYQRIALFPLVLFLGMAIYKNEPRLVVYSLPLVFLGAFLALYQTLTLYFPALQVEALCGQGHCAPLFSLFGFLTFPLLSFLGFFAIGLFLRLTKKS